MLIMMSGLGASFAHRVKTSIIGGNGHVWTGQKEKARWPFLCVTRPLSYSESSGLSDGGGDQGSNVS